MRERTKRILVTDAERGASVATIRALGRAGYHVVAADKNPRSIGFRSRYAGEAAIYPPPEASAEEFVQSLLQTVVSKEIDLIIPVTEPVIQPIVRYRDLFDEATRVALPKNEVLAMVTNKAATLALATSLGVPIPTTFIAHSAPEALLLAKELRWPVVVKPISSATLTAGNVVEKHEVKYAGSQAQLKDIMRQFEGKCSVLLQNYHQGLGYGVELLLFEGEPLVAFGHKRLREFPLTGGASSYRESVPLDPSLYGYAVRLLRELGWTGLAMVEFKVDGPKAVLMEINGRIWGSLPLAVASGVNFPVLLTRLLLDGPDSILPQLYSEYHVGLKCRDMERDLMWILCVLAQVREYPFLTLPGRTQGFMALVGLLNPTCRFDLLCLGDPIPAFADIPRVLRKLLRKSFGTTTTISTA